jgi:hypothetical protein
MPRRVLQKMRAGDLKWKGPLEGLVFMRLVRNWAYLTLFLLTVGMRERGSGSEI